MLKSKPKPSPKSECLPIFMVVNDGTCLFDKVYEGMRGWHLLRKIADNELFLPHFVLFSSPCRSWLISIKLDFLVVNDGLSSTLNIFWSLTFWALKVAPKESPYFSDFTHIYIIYLPKRVGVEIFHFQQNTRVYIE